MPLSQCSIDSSSLLVRHDKIRCIKKFIYSVTLLPFYDIFYFLIHYFLFDNLLLTIESFVSLPFRFIFGFQCYVLFMILS